MSVKEALAKVKEIIAKNNPTDEEVGIVLQTLKEGFKSKYWPVAEEILRDYVGAVDQDEIDELLAEAGLEGEAFKKPQMKRIKLLKSQNSKACGEVIDPAKIGMFIHEELGEDENGDVKCKLYELGREVPVIPVIRIPYVAIRVEKNGTAKLYRIFPDPEHLDRPFPFIERVATKATNLLTKANVDEFKVRKAGILFAIFPPLEGQKMPFLGTIDLTPVDSFVISEFERKIRQETGKSGYAAIFKVGKKPILKSKRVELKNGHIVVATSIEFGAEKITNKDDWRIILIPIVTGIKNYISKLPHDFTLTDVESIEGKEPEAQMTVSGEDQKAGGASKEEPMTGDEALMKSIEQEEAVSTIADDVDFEDTGTEDEDFNFDF